MHRNTNYIPRDANGIARDLLGELHEQHAVNEADALAHLQRCKLEYQTTIDDYAAVKRGVTLRQVDRALVRLRKAEQDYNRAQQRVD